MHSNSIKGTLSNINFDTTVKRFYNTEAFLKALENAGFVVGHTTTDLLYFSDGDRPFQDYDGFDFMVYLKGKNGKKYLINVRQMNGTKYRTPYIFRDFGNVEIDRENDVISLEDFLVENGVVPESEKFAQ